MITVGSAKTVEALDALPAFAAVIARVEDNGGPVVWQKDLWGDWRSMVGTYSADRLATVAVGPIRVVFEGRGTLDEDVDALVTVTRQFGECVQAESDDDTVRVPVKDLRVAHTALTARIIPTGQE